MSFQQILEKYRQNAYNQRDKCDIFECKTPQIMYDYKGEYVGFYALD